MKGAHSVLPEHFEWYREQIAGHHPSVIKNGEPQIGFVKECGSEQILKPVQEGVRGQCEVALYEEVTNATSLTPSERRELLLKFAVFLPKYFGLRILHIASKEIECLVLEDLTHRYKQPCSMDIKMGKVTFDPNATTEKRISESVKYPAQTILGFRLLGYRMHCDGDEERPRIRDKQWGRSRNESNIVQAFGEFLSGRRGEELRVAEEALAKLYVIRDWFNRQRVYHMYASSILILYEGSTQSAPSVDVKLIDFSHVFPAEDLVDENYVFGLENVVRFVEQFRDSLRA